MLEVFFRDNSTSIAGKLEFPSLAIVDTSRSKLLRSRLWYSYVVWMCYCSQSCCAGWLAKHRYFVAHLCLLRCHFIPSYSSHSTHWKRLTSFGAVPRKKSSEFLPCWKKDLTPSLTNMSWNISFVVFQKGADLLAPESVLTYVLYNRPLSLSISRFFIVLNLVSYSFYWYLDGSFSDSCLLILFHDFFLKGYWKCYNMRIDT